MKSIVTERLTKFSVLIPIYQGTNSLHLSKALDSISKQTVQPSEILLIQEGSVCQSVCDTISEFKQESGLNIRHKTVAEGIGLGKSLSVGVELANYPLIARMDDDDISIPDRFSKQIEEFEKDKDLDVLGGYVAEFSRNIDNVESIRRVPKCQEEIKKRARKRCPMNHGTVMFRRGAVISAGNYRPTAPMEDYDLWVRMLMDGSKFRNIPEILLKFRAEDDMFGRRGGLNYAHKELQLQSEFYRNGFTSTFELVRNSSLRCGVRLLPTNLRKWVYRKFARTSPDEL